jgi:hypothetical protein
MLSPLVKAEVWVKERMAVEWELLLWQFLQLLQRQLWEMG